MQEGIIINNIANLYRVKVNDITYEATARGKLKNNEMIPVVGDRVIIEVLEEDNKKAVIEKILDRTIYIKRPKLANLTQIIFVISAKMPSPDLKMLDKQLAYAEFLGIKPIIVINKIDLEEQEEINKIEKIYKDIGYIVLKTNAKMGHGVQELKDILKEQISAFSGNSGVGKSTLINQIFNNEVTQEGIISSKNKKGKNTTTSVCLYSIDKDSYIADTPGFSTFEIPEIESKQLDNYFIEFKNKKENCEFVGCTHIKEEQCAIKKALKNKEIATSRYDNYITIYNQLVDKEAHKW